MALALEETESQGTPLVFCGWEGGCGENVVFTPCTLRMTLCDKIVNKETEQWKQVISLPHGGAAVLDQVQI